MTDWHRQLGQENSSGMEPPRVRRITDALARRPRGKKAQPENRAIVPCLKTLPSRECSALDLRYENSFFEPSSLGSSAAAQDFGEAFGHPLVDNLAVHQAKLLPNSCLDVGPQ